MCRIFNQSGTFSTLFNNLRYQGIYDFSSMDDILQFQKNFSVIIKAHSSNIRNELLKEKEELPQKIQLYQQKIQDKKVEVYQMLRGEINLLKNLQSQLLNTPSNLIIRIYNKLIIYFMNFKIKKKEKNLKIQIMKSVEELENDWSSLKIRYYRLVEIFDKILEETIAIEAKSLIEKHSIINENKSYIYGAIGEEKVIQVLSKLSNEYTLINDFTIYLKRAVYHRKTNTYIRSIQIDHLMICRAGFFIIETKNWSKETLEAENSYSPHDQIARFNFIIHLLLKHNFGKKKLSVRNILVLMNKRPIGEFQYIKVLSVDNILGYIQYFPPTMTIAETEEIVQFFLEIQNSLIRYL